MKANVRYNIYKHMKCPICQNENIKLKSDYKNEKTFVCLICGFLLIFLNEDLE